MTTIKTLKTENKAAIASRLRAYADSKKLTDSMAAIEALGELGGIGAITHLEELMDNASVWKNEIEDLKWAALLIAYGRAGRMLPE